MILRIYERTPDRLLINTYYASKRNATEIYAGTIRLERYATAQTTDDESYMGMIDLLMLKTDDELVGLSDVFEDIQQAKHMAAQALGIYLMAMYDGPWVDESQDAGSKTPAMIAGEEREELLQLRQEKAQMEADREELLRLRLEAQNRKTVLAELERCAKNWTKNGAAVNRTSSTMKRHSANKKNIRNGSRKKQPFRYRSC